MKRIVLLILALLLLSDLAEDGCLGKAKYVTPSSSAKTIDISHLHSDSGKVDNHYTLPSAGGEICPPMEFQPVTLAVQPALKIIIPNHNGSSGGIPL
jgi:hypothetical protein